MVKVSADTPSFMHCARSPEPVAWAMAKGSLSLVGVGVGVEPARVESMFALRAMAAGMESA